MYAIKDFLSGFFKEPTDPFREIAKDAFLDKIKTVHMGDWERHYGSPILDGTQWSVEILLFDGTKRRFDGNNNYPPNFDLFLGIMGMEESRG